jgi:hypothetical protein
MGSSIDHQAEPQRMKIDMAEVRNCLTAFDFREIERAEVVGSRPINCIPYPLSIRLSMLDILF